MRITNKIMQNNSLYNINNNKVTEDQLNTMLSTGKKVTRPSDDPVIAIRALRLRSNVTQLSQYYEKNAKDAESWLNVTADALSTVTSVLTDCVKQATKGSSKDLTLDDLSIIVTQMDALAKEYYSTGNVDYAGRYIFTGYRTDTPLTFDKTDTADYRKINDVFDAGEVSEAKRILGKWNLATSKSFQDESDVVYENEIVETTVGRIRLSYDNLNYPQDYSAADYSAPELKWREALTQPATSTLADSEGTTNNVISLTYKNADGVTRYISVPVSDINQEYTITSDGIQYVATQNGDGSYVITGRGQGENYEFLIDKNGNFEQDRMSEKTTGDSSLETRQVTKITYTSGIGIPPVTVSMPLLPAIDQSYSMSFADDFTATVNSDGTYTINSTERDNGDGTFSKEVVQVTGNGSVYSSYLETSIKIGENNIIYSTTSEEDIDKCYQRLSEGSELAYLNAATGEILLNADLKNKLTTLPDLINAKTIDVVYDKKEWESGDIRPENLFACEYNYVNPNGNKNTILYNKGSAGHDIAYDVGFAQSVVVNTTADAVFTTNVKRDVNDLSNKLGEAQQMATNLKILKEKLAITTDDTVKKNLENQISSATKAYDYLREEIQKEFEHKITSMQNALDTANIAVTDNGTRSKRLDLINSRLMDQTTTFKTLQSENEDIDLAEAATKLTTAQVTYEASLMATGKISQTSLMNYI